MSGAWKPVTVEIYQRERFIREPLEHLYALAEIPDTVTPHPVSDEPLPIPAAPSSSHHPARVGLIYAILAYLAWGFMPVYFKQVVLTNPDDLTSPREGRGRFNFECYVLSWAGLNPAKLSPAGRETAQFLFDGFFPFVVLILVSLFTRPPDRARLDQFYGKMKTPVGATPELEVSAMTETARAPHRFNHTKLFGADSAWEFCRWDRVDTLGFLGCCATSGTIILVFWLLLRWAMGT